MGNVSYKRRNYLIKKEFQLKYTLSIVLTLLIVMAITGIGVYMGIWASIMENFSSFKVAENLENAKRLTGYELARYKKGDFRLEKIFREAELLSVQQKQAVKEALRSVNRLLAPKLIILVIFIFAGGIFLSHKIAGPLYRFEKSAHAISEGDLRVGFHIRKGDAVQETATFLNDMVENLQKDIDDIKRTHEQLKTEIESLKGKIDFAKEEKLKLLVSGIDTVLSKYKT